MNDHHPHPQQPRYSIRTNLRHIQFLPVLAKSLITLCIFIILYFLVRRSDKSGDLVVSSHEESNSNQIVRKFQFDLQDIHGSFGDFPPIPIVHSPLPKCENKKKHQLEESLKNIQIFQLIRASVQPFHERLQHHFMKIQSLSVIKHPKFTSPIRPTETSILSLDFWNPFKRNEEQNYKNVQRIFNPRNKDEWSSAGQYLTVVWDQPIRPRFMTLRVKQKFDEKYLHIYGISVVDSVLVNRNTFESTFIKEVKIKGGQNNIECDELACTMEYSMLMIAMDPLEILSIELYSQKEPYISYNYKNVCS